MALHVRLIHPDGSPERISWDDATLGRVVAGESASAHIRRLERWVLDRLADRGLTVADADLATLRRAVEEHLHRSGDGREVRLHLITLTPGQQAARSGRRPDTRALEEALRERTPVWAAYDHPAAGADAVRQVAEAAGYQCHLWRMGLGFEPPLPGAPLAGDAAPQQAPTLIPSLQAALAWAPAGPALLALLDLPARSDYLDLSPAGALVTRLAARAEVEPLLRLVVLRPEDEIPPRWRGLFRLVRLRTARSGTPILDALADDLTASARAGRLAPLVGREAEVDRLLDILNRAEGLPNSPLLVGPAGVGKTAVVEGLAQRVAEGRVPARFHGRRVMSLSVTALGANAQHIGELESQLRLLIAELEEHAHNLIVFVDEVHTILRIGGDGAPAAQALKASLGRGQIALVGATTDAEVAEVERDPAFSRRFSRVIVSEPDRAATTAIALRWRDRLEDFHGLSIPAQVISLAIEQADWHLVGQHRPYNVIGLLGDAAARAQRLGAREVTEHDLYESLRLSLGMAVRFDEAEEWARLERIERQLRDEIIGQEPAIVDLMRQVRGRRFRRDQVRTPFTVLLVGPTGVGKTEVATRLGRLLFEPVEPMLYHMETFSQEHQATDLVGAPASFIGFDQGSRLVNDIRGRPRVALIFDEIEKAHERVAQVLMGILDRGDYTDPRGLRGDFRHAWFIFTTNIVSIDADPAMPRAEYEELVREEFAARSHFPPELVARFGRPIRFLPLAEPSRVELAGRALRRLAAAYAEGYNGLVISWQPGLDVGLAGTAGDPAQGSRPILRRIEESRAAIADAMFSEPALPREVELHLDGDVIIARRVR